jgi:uncharacterized membrane protein YccC
MINAPARGRTRASRLLADLVVFDPARFAWRLGLRTTVGMVVPLVLGRALGLPELYLVGLAAYLLAFADQTDNADHRQVWRLAFGAILSGLALTTGILAGGNLALAIFGTLAWGLLAGLMAVYGAALMMIGLPIVWAFAVVGLSIPGHAFDKAIELGLLYTLGGGVIVVLTWFMRAAGPYEPLKRQTAICFRTLASFLTGLDRNDSHVTPVSPETRVRAAVAEARRIAADLRQGSPGWTGVAEKQSALIEVADRVFTLSIVFRGENPDKAATALPLFADAANAIATALTGPAETRSLTIALARFESLAVTADTPIEQSIATEISVGLRIVLGEASRSPAAAEQGVASNSPWRPLAPLVACFDGNAVMGRHALRFAAVTAVAVVCFWYFPKPFGYWIPLTVTVLLRPYAGVTLTRTVQRVIGTVAGIVVSSALLPFSTTAWAQLGLMGVAFFFMMSTMGFNYGLSIFFLSAGLLPFEHFVHPEMATDVAFTRLAATGIGATLAVSGSYLLWPMFERDAIPALLAETMRSIAAYTERVLNSSRDPDAMAAIEAARRKAGLDLTNVQSAVQRSLSEAEDEVDKRDAGLLAAASLQRLMNALNVATLDAMHPAKARTDLTSIAIPLTSYLQKLGLNCNDLWAALAPSME